MRKIEVKENKTSYIDTEFGVKQSADTEELFKKLFQDDYISPPSLRWRDVLREIYVFEFPPEIKMVYGEYFDTNYSIPFPWQVYICIPSRKQIFFFTRTQQIQSLDDTLNHQFMTNIYRSGIPCGGVDISLENNPIIDSRNMINKIWMSSFNGGCYIARDGYKDYGAGFRKAMHDSKESFLPQEAIEEGYGKEFWQKKYIKWLDGKSIEEILNWKWKEVDTLRNTIEWAYDVTSIQHDKTKVSQLRSKMSLLQTNIMEQT